MKIELRLAQGVKLSGYVENQTVAGSYPMTANKVLSKKQASDVLG